MRRNYIRSVEQRNIKIEATCGRISGYLEICIRERVTKTILSSGYCVVPCISAKGPRLSSIVLCERVICCAAVTQGHHVHRELDLGMDESDLVAGQADSTKDKDSPYH